MKAIICDRFGSPSVLNSREIETPTPADNEILIRTCATTVTAGDCRVRALNMPAGFGLIGRLVLGFKRPRQAILGSELSGTIVAIGKNVTKFKLGDEVILFTGTKLGCYAEYKAVSQDAAVILKPANLSLYEAAAMASSGTTALSFLRRGQVQKGSRVLVIGASGGVGSAAVMLAKHLGAHVTAVCSSKNLDFVSSLGADQAIDYTKEDFTSNGETYDAILDTTGRLTYRLGLRSLKEEGRLLLVSATLPEILGSAFATIFSKLKVVSGPAPCSLDDLLSLSQVVESGEYRVPIDRIYSFDQIGEAHAYVDTGRKVGNVVLTTNLCSN